MRKEYENDITKDEVLRCLDNSGLRFKDGQRYILSCCPLHDDKNPSAQIYTDDWFVNCNAGCGRFHITKAFPELGRRDRYRDTGDSLHRSKPNNSSRSKQMNYKQFDLMEQWKIMPELEKSDSVHTIPAEVLNNLGWRAMDSGDIFIPYFSRTKASIPFAQYRHLEGSRRFTMLKDAKPTMYGTWNLIPGGTVFLVEGTSDAAVLQYAEVPWIAAPSASSGELVGRMAGFCAENDIKVVFAGDNDEPGLKLMESLDEHIGYRVRQARSPYKDWGEMLEAEGVMSVQEYCFAELFPNKKSAIERKSEELFPS